MKRALALMLFLAAVVVLAYSAFTEAATRYYTVEEWAILPPAEKDHFARVQGEIQPGSIQWNPAGPELRFILYRGDASVPVVYRDVKPDVFQEDMEAV
ncbi:MAG: cytochrome c maturation protein CcmE, partial [Bacillota bacterium]|nr:cytochrome c maturation protein CcmE [Bacillota bacterium]